MKDTLGKEFYESADKTITVTKQEQTAIEWLLEVVGRKGLVGLFTREELNQFEEIEKQQKGYSEEEVYHILCEHTAFLFAGGKSTLTDWFETVKKK